MSIRTPGPSGTSKRAIVPGAEKPARGILGIDPDLDRVATPRRTACRRQCFARRDADLLAHDVDARHQLRDGVLDLEPTVHLDEVERAVGPDEELERAGVAVADRAARPLDGRLHLLACRRVEGGRRRLLDELLVPALDRALALAEGEHAAVGVAEHLDLDVTSRRDELLDVHGAVSERRLRLGTRRLERTLELVVGLDEAHPLPPAPRRGLDQHRKAGLRCRTAELLEPGRLAGAGHERNAGRPHSRFARTLSPICSTTSAGGPMKTMSESSHAATNSAFSARNPYPGCTASHAVVSAAATTFEICR